jgi:hypothetical protein
VRAKWLDPVTIEKMTKAADIELAEIKQRNDSDRTSSSSCSVGYSMNASQSPCAYGDESYGEENNDNDYVDNHSYEESADYEDDNMVETESSY